jgi:hypothetical protein
LKVLKDQLEAAKLAGDNEKMNSLLEDERLQECFQHPLTPIDPLSAQGKESIKMEKLLKKTSREIYKLRKSRIPRGKPDLVSFKEKMAFFTNTPAMIPLVSNSNETLGQPKDCLTQEEMNSFHNSEGSPGIIGRLQFKLGANNEIRKEMANNKTTDCTNSENYPTTDSSSEGLKQELKFNGCSSEDKGGKQMIKSRIEYVVHL